MRRAARCLAAAAAAVSMLAGCRDVSDFDTRGQAHYEGAVVSGTFVRSGIADGTRMCLTLDTARLQDGPGAVTTSDARFRDTALRPIPQVWHDPISTLSFGEGRRQNLVYALTPTEDGGVGVDTLAIVSLMQSGAVEVRLVRGAPGTTPGGASPVFGVFTLERREGSCAL